MAIKGKGKTRRGRAVAPAPRPVIVARKPPIYRRKGLLITLVVILVVGVGAGVYVAVHNASKRSFQTEMRQAVSKYSNQMVVHIPTDRQSAGGDTLFLYPDASGDLDSLASGKTKPADSLQQANSLSEQTKKALTAIQAIKINGLIQQRFDVGIGSDRSPGLTLSALRDAQFLIIQGLRGYERVFTLWKTAAQDNVDPAVRRQLVGEAQTLAADSERLFDEGWTRFVQVRHQAGLPQVQVAPTNPAPAPTVLPTTSPSPSGSPASTPSGSSPSASASG
jgi:hypothetical protein